jgi:hypothetical protein
MYKQPRHKYHYDFGLSQHCKPRKKKAKFQKNHADTGWINSKIRGNGGSFGFSHDDGCARIYHIGGASKLLIFWYNIILWGRYVRRRVHG